MLCPIDQTELVITERQGVEIDYCPKCRGVWLDRGELDKIIDRANQAEAGYSSASAGSTSTTRDDSFTTPRVGNMQGRVQRMDWDDDDDDRDSRDNRDQHGRKKTRRRSFFEDLFDFD